MSKERVSQQATSSRSTGTPRTSSISEKAGPVGQTPKGALTHDHIAQLAYKLYEQRGKQEGRAVEDWLDAELQLARVLGQS